eukprot:3664284-Alexandrium_andersonii.AAC.1
MSASLVGSEMCIRDSRPSPPPDPQGKSSDQEAQLPGREGIWGGSSPARACAAVSYTHLTLPTICSV